MKSMISTRPKICTSLRGVDKHSRWMVCSASVNGEVLGIYVLARGSKCSVVIADWLVCIADISGLGFDHDVFLGVQFLRLFFFFFCFSVVLVSRWWVI